MPAGKKLTNRKALIEFCKTLGQDVREDYPFDDPNWTVMRHWENKKGFAFLYEYQGGLQVNVKCDPEWTGFWRSAYEGVLPGYHMNKAHWNTILLNGSVPDKDIKTMLADSYRLTQPKGRKTQVRKARPEDAGRLLEIYAYYVKNTAITFEYDVPSLEEFQKRMEKTMERYPYLVIEKGREILGYAYAGPFVGRAAYDWSCETTIYLDHNAQKQGLGRILYEALETELQKMGILNLYACIGYPEQEDEFLTWNSARFHEHLGFSQVGKFQQCGYKFGRWYHMIWMEKIIGEHKAKQPPIKSCSKA